MLLDASEFFPFHVGNVLTEEENRSGSRLDQPIDASQQCGFSRAAESDDDEELAIVYLKVDPFQSVRSRFIDFVKIFDF